MSTILTYNGNEIAKIDNGETKSLITKNNYLTSNIKVSTSYNHNLPAEYQEVLYLASTGVQYINTGIYGDCWQENIITFTLKDKRQLMGASPNRIAYWGMKADNNYEFGYEYDNAIAVGKQDTIIVDYKTNAICNMWCNGNLVRSIAASVSTEDISAKEWQLWALGSSWNCTMKLYRSIFKQNNTIVRYFIPCYRISDSKPGLYDLITSSFYTNAGSGVDFTIGDEISKI